MLIKAYGLDWNPELVRWKGVRGDPKHLNGRCKIDDRSYTVNFWDSVGMYVLYKDYQIVYVGQAFETRLGPRIKHHLSDRFGGRWDMFSWFCLSTPNKNGAVSDPGQRQLEAAVVLNSLEAVSILVSNPPLNRKRESIPGACRVEQVEEEKADDVRQQLIAIHDELSSLKSYFKPPKA